MSTPEFDLTDRGLSGTFVGADFLGIVTELCMFFFDFFHLVQMFEISVCR